MMKLILFLFVVSYIGTVCLQNSTAVTGVVEIGVYSAAAAHDSDAKDSVHSEDQPELTVQQFDVDAMPCSCYECSVKFESTRELTTHLMMHAILKPFCCGRCLQPFAEADETMQHFNKACWML
mgnify:CR=1 FL=1